jgi:hypothetical protein
MRTVTVSCTLLVAAAGCVGSSEHLEPSTERIEVTSAHVTAGRCFDAPPADLEAACCSTDALDADEDGVADACENAAAERFAPILFHSADESNFPTNVDWMLQRTTLAYYDDDCAQSSDVREGPLTQALLLDDAESGSCGSSESTLSSGTRSRGKHRTFYLHDLDARWRGGSFDSRDWVTYVHAYPSTLGGLIVQYWRAYAYNDAMTDHGGDWEGVHIQLDDRFEIARVWFLGHTAIRDAPLADVQIEGRHVRVFSEGGGHASRPDGHGIDGLDPWDPATFVRQETWTGGAVTWFGNARSTSGGLRNVGEKRHPLGGQVFIQYSGLWGSPGDFYGTSGYWGPAFNETGMRSDSALQVAWCHHMLTTNADEECYATDSTR